jgi:hypothetical protein
VSLIEAILCYVMTIIESAMSGAASNSSTVDHADIRGLATAVL